jgi:hypothetical protein
MTVYGLEIKLTLKQGNCSLREFGIPPVFLSLSKGCLIVSPTAAPKRRRQATLRQAQEFGDNWLTQI